MDIYEEKGWWPGGDRSKEESGEAQDLRAQLKRKPKPGEWCVCRLVYGFGDKLARPLNLPSDRTATMYSEFGEGAGLCFDPEEPIFTCSEADARAMAGPGERGMEFEDIAVRCDRVTWRTIIQCSYDGSCAHLYEGGDLAKAELWRSKAQQATGGRKFYPVKCIVEGVAEGVRRAKRRRVA